MCIRDRALEVLVKEYIDLIISDIMMPVMDGYELVSELRSAGSVSYTHLAMKKKTALTKMHIAPSTVRYDAVAARVSIEVGQILAGTRKRNGYSLVAFSELLLSLIHI